MSTIWSPELVEKRRRVPWWLAIGLVVPSAIFMVWWAIAEFSGHSWTVPARNELFVSDGVFSTRQGPTRNPYGIRIAGGRSLGLSCYPELADNTCIPNISEVVGQPVKVRYFVAHPKDPFRQWVYGSTPNIVMEIESQRGVELSFDSSRKRLELWSIQEEGELFKTVFLIPFGIAGFIFGVGALVIYTKLGTDPASPG